MSSNNVKIDKKSQKYANCFCARASETTYFAVGQPSINLRVSVGQPVKKLSIKNHKNMQIVFVHGALKF